MCRRYSILPFRQNHVPVHVGGRPPRALGRCWLALPRRGVEEEDGQGHQLITLLIWAMAGVWADWTSLEKRRHMLIRIKETRSHHRFLFDLPFPSLCFSSPPSPPLHQQVICKTKSPRLWSLERSRILASIFKQATRIELERGEQLLAPTSANGSLSHLHLQLL